MSGPCADPELPAEGIRFLEYIVLQCIFIFMLLNFYKSLFCTRITTGLGAIHKFAYFAVGVSAAKGKWRGEKKMRRGYRRPLGCCPRATPNSQCLDMQWEQRVIRCHSTQMLKGKRSTGSYIPEQLIAWSRACFSMCRARCCLHLVRCMPMPCCASSHAVVHDNITKICFQH